MSDIKVSIGNSIPYTEASVTTTDKGRYHITLSIYDPKEITYMATYVKALLAACDGKVAPEQLYQIELNQCYEDGSIMITFRTSDDGYGELIDWRSGEAKLTEVPTENDLLEQFPASKIEEQKKNALSEEDLAMYNEVMDILNSDFSKTEDQIYSEIAPNYGMTKDELAAFMKDSLKKIYS